MSQRAGARDIETFRARCAESARRARRRFEVREATELYKARSRVSVFEAMTEQEVARLLEVAPRLMGVK